MPRPPRIRVSIDLEPSATLTRERAHRDAVRYVLGAQLGDPSVTWHILAVSSFSVADLQRVIWNPETGERLP